MARNLGNPFERPGEKRGDQFEYDVCEYLRRNLPQDYVYLHGVVVSSPVAKRPGQQPKRVPREIDVVVAGPNGLFLIEAKSQKRRARVEGTLMGGWTFVSLTEEGFPSGKGSERPRPGEHMRVKLTQVRTRILVSGGQRFHPYEYARAVFVFPDYVDIRIVDYETKQPPAGDLPFRLVHLSELAETILTWEAPYLSDGRPAAKLSAEDAESLLRFLSPGVIDRLPDHVRDYEVVGRGAIHLASNGLPYSVNELRHSELGTRRRGKWYDWSALQNKEREQFEEQVKRHARVLAALEGYTHIHQYHEFFPDPHSGGYWLIEEWIEGETLDDILDTPAETALDIRQLMLQVALGLRGLHLKGFVHRELNPGSIIIENDTNRAVISNFELAKALDGSPTVSTEDVKKDPYRAPEVVTDPHSVDTRADIYSWAAILFRLATGQLYIEEGAIDLLGQSHLPKAVVKLLQNCLQPLRSNRPASISEVIRALESWRPAF